MSGGGGKGGFAKGFLLPKAKSPRQAASQGGAAEASTQLPAKDPHKRLSEEERLQSENAEPVPSTRDGDKSAQADVPPEEDSPEKRTKREGDGEGMEVERNAAGETEATEAFTSQEASTSGGPEKASFGTRRKPVVIIVIGMAGRLVRCKEGCNPWHSASRSWQVLWW